MINNDNSYYDLHEREEFVNIHCHRLPWLDDSPRTTVGSLELYRRMSSKNVNTVVATPHQLGRFDVGNKVEHLRQAVYDLSSLLKKNSIPLEIVPGTEVRVDERICRFSEADRILTLAHDSRYVFLNLPNEAFIDIKPLLVELSSIGIESIIAHAELIMAI